MNARKTADLTRIAAIADHTISLHSDLKSVALDDALRDLSSIVKTMLRKKRCEVEIVVVSDAMR